MVQYSKNGASPDSSVVNDAPSLCLMRSTIKKGGKWQPQKMRDTFVRRKKTHHHEKMQAAMDKTTWEMTHHNGNDNGLSLIMECFEEMVACQKAHVANIAD